ncbi:conjugal transfer protein TraS [Escherichia coli]|uniref:Conjugal transfer protein TraS n=1 Tax=Escherichia coli TaxID=562 RepID=A0A2X1NHD7_ECOLX|nr:conjugal transfer protein TraS [Escherichia coli]SQC97970.1 conjugal transfer protein TraS [Escherichia coli]STL57675.1 conjugal transfer protein TraS [Escherichia coli]STO17784.1 conjugal transfer protein TraS [Escherichia coli]STO41673.1 conjugal transfer protein TraS [Escherichia coli]
MFNPYCFGNGDTVYRLLSGWLGECRNNFYAVLHSTMAGTVYMVVLSNTKKRSVSDEFKFSKGVWYITMPVSSLLSPLLSLMVFIIGTLYELRRVSGCISIKKWGQNQLKNQYDGSEKLDFGGIEQPPTTYYNPSTGYPMHGGFDSAGNTFGTRWQDYYDRQ